MKKITIPYCNGSSKIKGLNVRHYPFLIPFITVKTTQMKRLVINHTYNASQDVYTYIDPTYTNASRIPYIYIKVFSIDIKNGDLIVNR